jgi:general secretion pathway protein G
MKKARGFTLVEVLIVVAVVAVLAAIAVPNFLDAQTRSKMSQVRTDQRSIAAALEAYCLDTGVFPPMSDIGFDSLVSSPGFHSREPSYLTTPVAYIPTLLYDPFLENSAFSNLTYPDETNVGKRYCYLNYHAFLLASPSSSNIRTRYEEAGSWLLLSVGPDATLYNGEERLYLNYDATNGTVSSGNIFYTQKNPKKI